MTDETKRIFDAPWEILEDIDKKGNTFLEIYDSFRDRIAGCIEDDETARRFRRLPELYDALKEASIRECRECLHDEFRMGKKSCGYDYDFIQNGCPMKNDEDYCPSVKWWKLLKKVRDGE